MEPFWVNSSCWRLLFYFILARIVSGISNIPYQTPQDCIKLSVGAKTSWYFDTTQLKCVQCSQSSSYQTTSADGLSCVCLENFRLTSIDSGIITCEACPAGQVTSLSGWECVKCIVTAANTNSSDTCPRCSDNSITVERKLDGSWGIPVPTRVCQVCADNTWPNSDGTQCVRCNQVLSVLNTSTCTCPNGQQAGGICFKSPSDIETSIQKLFQVSFGDLTIDSRYFKDNIQAAAGMCQPSYGNVTACQLLSNLCVLILYNRGTTNVPNACTEYLSSVSSSSAKITADWPKNLPWLYYLSDKVIDILQDTSITTQFTFPNSLLRLSASTFSLNGTFLGFKSLRGGLLQLCKNSDTYLDAAFVFGTVFKQSCNINVRDFWDTTRYPMTFYDVWLEFSGSNGDELYAVPVLVENYIDSSGKSVNTGADQSAWQLVRRLFLVDNISGQQAGSSTGMAQGVRYAQSITIYVQLQPDQTTGRIRPPYIDVLYNTAVLDDYNNNRTAKVTFEVIYSMPLTSFELSMSIAVGVLLALAVIYSIAQTWGWSRRAGKISIDFVTLIKLIAFLCGNMANAFFVTTLGSSIWWLIFYKRQTNVYLLVDEGSSTQFVGFLLAAFLLKLVQLIHVIICQVSVDVFLIDWERPTGKIVPLNSKNSEAAKDAPVSVWRTYFIANEWSEIQTARRISPVFQYFGTVLILYVIGVGNLATMDSSSNLSVSTGESYSAPMSSVLRFALIGVVYLLLALLQLLFFTFIYERFFEHAVHQFVDLCSLANISVFLLENYQFGYYIHGRSVHGQADTGLREMHENFIREQRDLVSKRGLVSSTDEQSFEIAIPHKLRIEFDRILQPVIAEQVGGAARAATRGESGVDGSKMMLDPVTEKSISAYHRLNNFLQLFLDHSLRDVDYINKPKLLFETILGMEFKEPVDKALFYSGVGLSFSSLLFYGQEMTLVVFELLIFAVIDLGSFNYVLDAIITFIFMEIIVKSIRDGVGRSNLAKKTLVDKRFLI